MTVRLLHVSDLHTGTREDREVEAALASLVGQLGPELVVASGDLTHRGRREEHERAARFLASLGAPVLAVPGNHDLPYTFPARFTGPWVEFERQWQTTEPTYSSEGLHVVGLNSARPASSATRRRGSTPRPSVRIASRCCTITCSAHRGGRRASGPCPTATTCSGRSSRPAPT